MERNRGRRRMGGEGKKGKKGKERKEWRRKGRERHRRERSNCPSKNSGYLTNTIDSHQLF